MGPGETIALVAIVGGLIAVTILLGTIFKRIMSYKEKQLGLTADRTAEKAAQYASHVERPWAYRVLVEPDPEEEAIESIKRGHA